MTWRAISISPYIQDRSSPRPSAWGMDWDESTGEFAEHDTGPAADEQRGFNQIMDDHSLHEFIIRRGKTLDTTPEFESYQRAYAAEWAGGVAPLVRQLEAICARFAVPIAVVDGKALALCAEAVEIRGDGPESRVDELLQCLVNVDTVSPLITFGGNERAAVTVQRHARGMLGRKRVRRMRTTSEDAVGPGGYCSPRHFYFTSVHRAPRRFTW